MTAEMHEQLRDHLLRPDGQEDVCIGMYSVSTGLSRATALVAAVVLPDAGEREVHGNAAFSGSYVVRAASLAASRGMGLVLMHSHPFGSRWQGMSSTDYSTEESYARVAHTITDMPMIGMTLAGDQAWSARTWLGRPADGYVATDGDSVRVVGTTLRVSWNDELRPPPAHTPRQVRTVSAWGSDAQADLARLRVLVVGAGTVGLDVSIRLAQAGIATISVMDFDTVEELNLDRLLTATPLDAALLRSKAHVVQRALRSAATASQPEITVHELSVCEKAGHQVALDFDAIFSCVDRPWPRAVLNQIAMSDLIPVIDGGLAIRPFEDGGMRNATWRAHVVTPGRPCLQCNQQIDGAEVSRDRLGLYEDLGYIKAAGLRPPSRENVSLLAPSVTASLLAQFVSLVVAPGGMGVPAPLRFSLSNHSLKHLPYVALSTCSYEQNLAAGDARPLLTGVHESADAVRAARAARSRHSRIRIGRLAQDAIESLRWILQGRFSR